jgi:hypothetical protein
VCDYKLLGVPFIAGRQNLSGHGAEAGESCESSVCARTTSTTRENH